MEEHGALDALLESETPARSVLSACPYIAPSIDHIAIGVFDVFQVPYSAVEREHEAAIASAASKGPGIVIRGGATKGAPTREADWAAMGTLAPSTTR